MREASDPGPEGPPGILPRRFQEGDPRPRLPAPSSPRFSCLGPPSVRVQEPYPWAEEPPVEVLVFPDRIYVTVDFLGTSRESIDVEASQSRLTIRARSEGRILCKEVDLPEVVDPRGLQVTYRNGVLDLRLPRGAGRGEAVEGGERDA